MSEEDIRKYLSRQPTKTSIEIKPASRARPRTNAYQKRNKEQESFKNFSASHLLCPTCQKAMPVRERLLLVLPDGDLYDYVCKKCGTSAGTRKVGNTSSGLR